MADDVAFAEFVRRLRGGDDQAATELFRLYEPFVRREVRLHMSDPGLNPLFDSADVCQSVFRNFFARAAAGDYDLDSPQQVLKLLAAMARNKLAFWRRTHSRHRRDHHRTVAATALDQVAASGPTPDRVAAARELLAEVRGRLGEEERQLADLRAQGLTWPEIAVRLGGQPQARRRQLSRALDRIERQLHLDEA